MNLESSKNLLKDCFEIIYYKITDSAVYNICLEKYESLDIHHQKWIQFTVFLGAFSFLLFIPASILWSSLGLTKEFKVKKQLIFSLLQKDPQFASMSLSPSEFNSRISMIVSQFKSSPKEDVQIKPLSGAALIPYQLKKLKYFGKLIQVNNVNVEDAVKIGSLLEKIAPSVKLIQLKLTESSDEDNYFNVVFSLIYFHTPQSKKISPILKKS